MWEIGSLPDWTGSLRQIAPVHVSEPETDQIDHINHRGSWPYPYWKKMFEYKRYEMIQL